MGKLHQLLWEANADLVQACLAEPFVQGLADGSLDQAAFQRYVAQDAFFLRAFLKAYALGAVKCEQLEHICCFHGFMGGVLEELQLHSRYAASFGIDLRTVSPLPATRAYTDFLLRTAWSAGVDEIVAAMVPCMRLYAWLSQTLAPRRRENHPYNDWITTYASPAFEVLAVEIENLLDEVAEDRAVIREAYRYAMLCEKHFFAAPF
jgi:thiaminase/transcriptional activator TenA